MNAFHPAHDDPDTRLAERILAALRGLRYGSVEIVVHDGRVVQFEKRERVRFDRHDDHARR